MRTQPVLTFSTPSPEATCRLAQGSNTFPRPVTEATNGQTDIHALMPKAWLHTGMDARSDSITKSSPIQRNSRVMSHRNRAPDKPVQPFMHLVESFFSRDVALVASRPCGRGYSRTAGRTGSPRFGGDLHPRSRRETRECLNEEEEHAMSTPLHIYLGAVVGMRSQAFILWHADRCSSCDIWGLDSAVCPCVAASPVASGSAGQDISQRQIFETMPSINPATSLQFYDGAQRICCRCFQT